MGASGSRQSMGAEQGPLAGGGGGDGRLEEESKAVMRDLVGTIVRYAEVVRGLQQAHGELRHPRRVGGRELH